MSRLFTLLTIILTAAVSFGLYELSYEVQRLEDELLDTNRAIARERENIAVLGAEWSLMTRPDQLQRKAEQVLAMKTLTAKQIVSFDDIPWRKDAPKPEPKKEAPKSEPAPNAAAPLADIPMVKAEPKVAPAIEATPVRAGNVTERAKPDVAAVRPKPKAAPVTRDAQVDAVLASMARRQ